MLIGWIVKWDAKILAWNSPFRLEILCCCVRSQLSGSLPCNSSYLAFFAFLCADQLREWNEYSWYAGKCIWESKNLSRGCGSAHEAHLACVQGSEREYRKSLPSSPPEITSCPSSASVSARKILGPHCNNRGWWRERRETCITDPRTAALVFDLTVLCCPEFIYLCVEPCAVSSIKGKQTAFSRSFEKSRVRIRQTWVIVFTAQ